LPSLALAARIFRTDSSIRDSEILPDLTAATSPWIVATGSVGLRTASWPASTARTQDSTAPNLLTTFSYHMSSVVRMPRKPSFPFSQSVARRFSTLAGRSEPSATEGTEMCSLMT